MRKLALTAIAVAFALAACDNTPNDDVAAADPSATVAGETDTTVVVPGPTETATTVVTTPGATTTATGSGDQVSIGPDGVRADVGSGETRVRIDTESPTLTVQKK